MPRFRSARSPINSIKPIIDSEGVLTGGTASATPIAVAVPNVDTSTFQPGDIRVGATINAFFLSVFILGATGAGNNGSINWLIFKEHSGQAGSAPIPGQSGTSPLRNQIIHEEKGLAGSIDGTPMAFKGVVVVPRGMRRMREGDSWFVRVRGTDNMTDYNFCVKAIYKSFF